MNTYTGLCHCGHVTFAVSMDAPTEVMERNCGHCSK